MRAATSVAVAAAVLVTASCGVIPTPPEALPSDFYPDATASAGPSDVTTSDGFTREQHLAVRIRVETCTGWATGSGWILSNNQVVTNRHVIEGATHIEVTTYDGRDYIALSSQVAAVPDLGLVTLDAVFTETATHKVVTPQHEDEIVVVGYPSGQELKVQEGEYWRNQIDDVGDTGEAVWLLKAEAKPGSSGSAGYNGDGDVVAVLYAGDDIGTSLAWPVSWLEDLLEDPSGWTDNTTVCTQ